MAVVLSLGHEVEPFYDALLAGKSGVSPIESFDATDFPTRFAGEIKARPAPARDSARSAACPPRTRRAPRRPQQAASAAARRGRMMQAAALAPGGCRAALPAAQRARLGAAPRPLRRAAGHTRRRQAAAAPAAAARPHAAAPAPVSGGGGGSGGGISLRQRRRGGVAVAAAAAASAWPGGAGEQQHVSFDAREAAAAPAVAPLPAPPRSGESLVEVLPYLLKLAMAERQLSWRLGAAFAFMLVSKAAGLSGPLFLKAAVDALGAAGDAALLPAVRCVLCFGLCGIVQHLTKELTYPTFTPISQAVARRVAYQTFSHVLELDITFHMNRRTGRLSRILERGTRSIQMLYRAVLFTFAPTAIELVFVVGLLATRFSPLVAGLVGGTFVLYVAWTLTMTQAAVEVRKQVNQLDNLTTSKAVDALLNAETVALFNNRQLEVSQYDHYLRGYQAAAIQTERLAALLNAGQSVILSAGLTCVMVAAVIGGPAGEAAMAAAAAGSGVVAAAASAALGRGGGAAVSGALGAAASPGDLVLLQGLLLQLWGPLQFLGWFYREIRQSLVDMEEFFDILKTPNSLPGGSVKLPDLPPSLAPAAAAAAAAGAASDGADRQSLVEAALRLEQQQHPHSPPPGARRNLGSADGGGFRGDAPDPALSISGLGLEVELDDVVFGYNEQRQVLKGVSLRILPGESVAVVGASGSGKSTILKLVTRLYDASGGVVRVNGVDVRDLQTASLRSAVAVVPQDTVLFNDTILQNIRYGKPTAGDDEVIAAAQLAHLHEAVLRMPDGYGTMVGERGLKLSGGEKQRVAIARCGGARGGSRGLAAAPAGWPLRACADAAAAAPAPARRRAPRSAFLRAPRLLVCDEATSALDTATEASILGSLDELARGRTSIFVAHRLSTVAGCDRILVLSEGRLVEQGSHGALLAAGGVYADMWRAQAAEDRAGAGAAPPPGSVEDGERESALVEPLPALSNTVMQS
ncbi:ATM1 [Scenedesmus sp. PABB004]|nr:ATM1 [Scenedesmus sp. PABB004]